MDHVLHLISRMSNWVDEISKFRSEVSEASDVSEAIANKHMRQQFSRELS